MYAWKYILNLVSVTIHSSIYVNVNYCRIVIPIYLSSPVVPGAKHQGLLKKFCYLVEFNYTYLTTEIRMTNDKFITRTIWVPVKNINKLFLITTLKFPAK
jgi:hypothetical protein